MYHLVFLIVLHLLSQERLVSRETHHCVTCDRYCSRNSTCSGKCSNPARHLPAIADFNLRRRAYRYSSSLCGLCVQEAGSDGGGVDAVMASAPGSSAGGAGGSPISQHMQDDTSAAADEAAGQPQQADQPPLGAASAAVVHPAAAEAAGPHYPGHPPGASLAPLAAVAAPAAAGSNDGSNAGSSARSRQGVLTDDEAAHILGSQANLWTEYVADEATAEYMLLPRLAALAEAVW